MYAFKAYVNYPFLKSFYEKLKKKKISKQLIILFFHKIFLNTLLIYILRAHINKTLKNKSIEAPDINPITDLLIV